MYHYKKFQNSKELMKLLNKNGWTVCAIKGSHYQLNHHLIKGRVTIPHPKKDLPIGTLRSILNQAKINIQNE